MDISRLRQQLREAGRQFDRQLRTLKEHDPLLRGGVYRLRRKCGKAGCRCARGELHESWVLLTREQGVQRMRAVPKGQLAKWRAWTECYRRFRLARRELTRQYREVLKLASLLEAARAVAPPASDEGKGNGHA
ncbi:MAG: DUF6788 family protein [bacterium]